MIDESCRRNKWLPRGTFMYANGTTAHGLLMAARTFIATRCLFEVEGVCWGHLPAISIDAIPVYKQTDKMMRLDALTLPSTTSHFMMSVAYRILQPRPQLALRGQMLEIPSLRAIGREYSVQQ